MADIKKLNVREKLNIVQSKLKAPKGQFNKFGGYKYRSCEDILEAVKPLLNEVKAIITIEDEIVLVGDRFYVKAISTFVDTESNERIQVSACARESEQKKGMDSSQVTGATSSYARKYSLNGLLLIDDTKDADTMDNSQQEQPKKATTKRTANQVPITKVQIEELSQYDPKLAVPLIQAKGKKKMIELSMQEASDILKILKGE